MQKVTNLAISDLMNTIKNKHAVNKKIFGWLNAFRLAASLERRPAEAEFFVLAFGCPEH